MLGLFARRSLSMSACMGSKNVAVVLSGCGVYDGTEVHEAASCLASITRNQASPVCYSPFKDLAHVVNHQTGSEESLAKRSVAEESARIFRSPIKDLKDLDANDEDVIALVIPGGFGVAKNLSDFGFKGAEMTVDEDLVKVMKDFQKVGKPIGLCCISPILAAKVFENPILTLGRQGDKDQWPYGDAVDAARGFGANVVEADVTDVVVDEELKIVTTPAFMYNGQFHEIQDGVKNMIDTIFKLTK